MSFIIQGLDPRVFGSLFHQKQVIFNGAPVERHGVMQSPGFPCRITLDDAKVGETALLVSYNHHDAVSPYRQSGPIFVTEGAPIQARFIDESPPALARRSLSLRVFDSLGSMVDAQIVDGAIAKDEIVRLFGDTAVTRIDAHYAQRGCFAAHIVRRD